MPFVIPFRFSFEWKKTKPEMGEGGRHFEWEARVASLLLCYPSYLYFFSRFFEWLFQIPVLQLLPLVVPTFFPSQLLQKNLPNSCKHAFSHPYTWSLCEHTKLWRESFNVAAVAVPLWECEMQTSLTSRRIIFFKSVGIFWWNGNKVAVVLNSCPKFRR